MENLNRIGDISRVRGQIIRALDNIVPRRVHLLGPEIFIAYRFTNEIVVKCKEEFRSWNK